MQEVSSVTNNIANPQHKLNVGVVAVPDKLPKPVLYNAADARKKFKTMSDDVFEAKEKISYEDTTKTPKGVIAVGVGIVTAIIAVKTGVYSKIKSIFKAV